MIITRLRGGLGNQMFQYACGKKLAAETGAALGLDLSWFRSPGAKDPKRNYALDIFDMKPSRASVLNIALTKIFGKILGEGAGLSDFHAKSAYLDGFWQSEKYFKGIEADVRKDFVLKGALLEDSKSIYAEIRNSDSVCLNVRRDDFVKDGKFVGVEYYRQAAEKMLGLVLQARFFVFSDDIEWCKANLGFLKDAAFVGREHAGLEFSNYLRLMTACKHFIIPNSTFGWWAAWLCPNLGKIVIAPKVWSQGGDILEDIVPADWIKI